MPSFATKRLPLFENSDEEEAEAFRMTLRLLLPKIDEAEAVMVVSPEPFRNDRAPSTLILEVSVWIAIRLVVAEMVS